MHQQLFSQLNLSSRELKNRIIAAVPPSLLASPTGVVTAAMIDYYERIATTNVSMVITEGASVSGKDRFFTRQLCGNSQDAVAGLSRMAERIRVHGALPIIQLTHPGINSIPENSTNFVNGPSPFKHPRIKAKVIPFTYDQIKVVATTFIEAAFSAWNAGYSGIEISGADGGLMQQFLSPLTNQRSDNYGYKSKSGGKFAIEIIKAVKKSMPDFLVIFKLAMKDLLPGGKVLKDSLAFAQSLEKAGVDMLHLTEGFPIGKADYGFPTGRTSPEAPFADDCQFLKNQLSIPVILSGKISSPEMAKSIINQGIADTISLGRSLNRDLGWLQKAGLQDSCIKVRECKRCPFCTAASSGCPDMRGIALWNVNFEQYVPRRNS